MATIGYRLMIADLILGRSIRSTPQTAARFVPPLGRWRRIEPGRAGSTLMRAELERIAACLPGGCRYQRWQPTVVDVTSLGQVSKSLSRRGSLPMHAAGNERFFGPGAGGTLAVRSGGICRITGCGMPLG
jgi:hypothetical protein